MADSLGTTVSIVFQIQDGAIYFQDGGTHARESRPCWKTAHQPQRKTGIGLTDFYGNEDRTNR